jgi:site-specific DNA-cytosine methylase
MRTHVDVFSGIGGFSLASATNNVKTIAHCENNEFLAAGLERAWPGVPCYRDVRTFPSAEYTGRVWLLTAGPPCQAVSLAGKRLGPADDRFLWDEIIEVHSVIQPTWALYENVPGIDVHLGGIIAQVEGIGYEVGVLRIPACAVNSPQDRDRFWIVANRTEPGPQGNDTTVLQGANRRAAQQPESESLANGVRVTTGSRESERCKAGQETGLEPESGAVADCDCERSWSEQQSGRMGNDRCKTENLWSDFFYVPMPKPDGTVEVRRAPVRIHGLAARFSAGVPRGVLSKMISGLGNAICWPVAAEIIRSMIVAEDNTCGYVK